MKRSSSPDPMNDAEQLEQGRQQMSDASSSLDAEELADTAVEAADIAVDAMSLDVVVPTLTGIGVILEKAGDAASAVGEIIGNVLGALSDNS